MARNIWNDIRRRNNVYFWQNSQILQKMQYNISHKKSAFQNYILLYVK